MANASRRLTIFAMVVAAALAAWALHYFMIGRFHESTVLMMVARAGDAEAVERELRDGADPNRIWNEGGFRVHGSARRRVTPLMFAVENAGPGSGSRARVVTLLLDAGADPCLVEPPNESPFVVAVKKLDLEAVRAFWENDREGCLESRTAEAMATGYTSLAYAPESSDAWAMVEYLIDDVAQPGEADHPGMLIASPLPAAQITLQRLLDRGVKADGESLVLASFYKPELIPWLVSHGADVNATVPGFTPDDDGPPLVRAAANPKFEGIRALVDAGADVNGADRAGRTPVSMLVCESSCTKRPHSMCESQLAALRLLLERGARRAGVSHFGKEIDACLRDRPMDPYRADFEALLGGSGNAPGR